MDDDEVLLENDALAIYLLQEKIRDFETVQKGADRQNDNVIQVKNEIKILRSYEEFQLNFENILKSGLLLEEDYNMLETFYSNNNTPHSNKIIYQLSLFGSLTTACFALSKYTNSSIIRRILLLCFAPLTFNIFKFVKRKLRNRQVSQLLSELHKLTNLIKRSLRIVGELSATIGYYSTSTINLSSFNSVHVRFAKEFYTILLSVIKTLACNSSEIIQAVPLTIENSMKYDLNKDLLMKSSVNNSDLKFLFELYILVQSDFIKTLGLSFCTYLWALPNCDINKVLTKIIPHASKTLRENVKTLNKEYTFLRNYGIHDRNKSQVKLKHTPQNYMNSCLHNAELHFQQLFCKTRDLQSLLDTMNAECNGEQAKLIMTTLNELDKQIVSSKNMIDAVTKYFTQLQKKDTGSEITIPVLQPTINDITNSVQNLEENKPEKLIYELYIPKEGLDLTELDVNSERAVFSIKDLNYSAVMLDELRTILRARNPEMFQEESTNKPEINSDSEDEDSYYRSKRRDIFRPSQPIGLAENLQSISQVLAARKAMLVQCEEIVDDVYSNSDTDEIIT